MKNILFLLGRLRHASSGSGMYADLVLKFAEEGHRVTVVTASRSGEPTGVYHENGIRVLRIRLPSFNQYGFVGKGVAQALLPHYYTRAVLRHPEVLTCDLVVTTTPPVAQGRVVRLIKKAAGARAYLILRDFVAQSATDLKMIRRGWPIHRWLRSKEQALLEACDSIGCMSPANIRCALHHYPRSTQNKCHVLKNFLAQVELPVPTETDRDEFGVRDKFVVVYGGNMGLPQHLENILELAARCADLEDVCFLMYGEGTQREMLSRQVEDRGLSNVQIAPSLDSHRYRRLLAVASVGLVSLHENLSVPSHPSKILGYLAQGLPVLASINSRNDLGGVIDAEGWGTWAPAGDASALESRFRYLYQNPNARLVMGQKGLECMAAEYGVASACETILRMSARK